MDAVGTNIRLDSRGRAGAALAAAHQRGRQRGVGVGQDAPRGRRPGPQPARQALCPRRRQAAVRRRWDEAFAAIAKAADGLPATQVGGLAGDLADFESVYALQGAARRLWLEPARGARQTARSMTCRSRRRVRFNPTIVGVEHAEAILLVGSQSALGSAAGQHAHPQGGQEAARRCSRSGREVDLTYPVEWLGDDIAALGDLPEALTGADATSIVIAGMGACTIEGGYGAARQTGRRRWARASALLHTAAGRVGALMLGFVDRRRPRRRSRRRRPSCCSCSAPTRSTIAPFAGAFKVYIGHAWRQGRACRGRDPAGRGLYREAGHLGQYSRAACSAPSGRCSRSATRARTGRSCARSSDVLGKTLPFDSLDAAARARSRRDHPALADEGLALVGRARSRAARRRRVGCDRLSDHGLLPHQPDRALVADDAALLGRTAPRRDLRGGGGMSARYPFPAKAGIHRALLVARLSPGNSGEEVRMISGSPRSLWLGYFIATILDILVIALPVMLAVAMIIYVDRKIWAAMALRRGPNVVGPFGLLQSLRRRAEGVPAGNDHPVGGEPHAVPDRADHHLHGRADRLGGDPVQLAARCWPTSMSACSTSSRSRRWASTASILAGWASNSKYPFYSRDPRRGADGELRSRRSASC